MIRYTIVFEWPAGAEPEINRDTSLLGGSVCAVQFNDALSEVGVLRERIAELESLVSNHVIGEFDA